MQIEENLNLEFNNACMVIKAVNAKGSIKEASKVLGVCETTVYEIIRRTHIKLYTGKQGRRYINPREEIVYRDDRGKLIKEFPIINNKKQQLC